MTDLVTWLRAQLDEDERAILAERHVVNKSAWYWCPASPEFLQEEGYGAPCNCGLGERRARVLRQVEAMRAILERHADPKHHCPDPYDPEGRSVLRSHVSDGSVWTEEVWIPAPCGDLRSLAYFYSDRPGYTEAVGE